MQNINRNDFDWWEFHYQTGTLIFKADVETNSKNTILLHQLLLITADHDTYLVLPSGEKGAMFRPVESLRL